MTSLMTPERQLAEENCVGLFLVGSHLYGTNTPKSDKDYEGVFIEPPEYVIGRKRIDEVNCSTNQTNERNTADDVDMKYYTLRKFFDLAALNNPNKLEWFFIPPENIVNQNKAVWDRVLEAKALFLSQKAKYSFAGYAASQRHKLVNKKQRLTDLREFLSDIEEAIERRHTKLGEFPGFWAKKRWYIQNNKRDKTAPWYLTVDEKHYTFGFELPKLQSQIQAQVDEYGGRTKDLKTHGYDLKFAAHLFRLMQEGVQLLEEGRIDLPLKDKGLITEIRTGKFTLDQILKMSSSFDKIFDNAQSKTDLPHHPDGSAIHKLQMEIYKDYWKEKGLI